MAPTQSGSAPFSFRYCPDFHRLPAGAEEHEVKLHGTFAVDKRAGKGQLYYGLPGSGLLRISADLTTQERLEIPTDLRDINFHSTKLGEFDGNMRLFLAANNDEKVVILTLDGEVDFVLSRPAFDEYAAADVPFKPTDTALDGSRLIVADGYGANYINLADLPSLAWTGLFGGKTTDPHEHGRFGTAHGLNLTPSGKQIAIADRLHSRFELYNHDGSYAATYALPWGARPCGIDFVDWKGGQYAVVGSLNDPEEGRPAPIYILDAQTYEILSTVRPKEDLGIELADHMHNVVWHVHNGRLFLVCQAWNPGYYFVLEQES